MSQDDISHQVCKMRGSDGWITVEKMQYLGRTGYFCPGCKQ